jgi:hypothetical protein
VIRGNSPNTQSQILIPTIEFDSADCSFVMTNTFTTTPPRIRMSGSLWAHGRISGGTGAYAGLQGEGMNTGSVNSDNTGFCTTYTGQVRPVGPEESAPMSAAHES